MTRELTEDLRRLRAISGGTVANNLTLRGLPVGAFFILWGSTGEPSPYENYGNGWYGRPYSGGPFHSRGLCEVILITGELRDRVAAYFAELRETE